MQILVFVELILFLFKFVLVVGN